MVLVVYYGVGSLLWCLWFHMVLVVYYGVGGFIWC